MASLVNKRQQARNERALQDLVRSVSGNDRCADCFTKNPAWASWSLGCFLCVRCASIHRKLGTHISKVKSLSMDTWSSEQVENMKRNGNVVVNRTYNPRNIKVKIPVDSEDVDAAVERYVRDKYQHRTLGQAKPTTQTALRHNTGSSSSTDDAPPAVPPKNDSFGLSFDSRQQRMSRIPEVEPMGRRRSFELKLAQLRDMGFPNEQRNTTVLKGLGGNLDKAIEALVRLGEGGSETRIQAQVQQQRLQQAQMQAQAQMQSQNQPPPPAAQQPQPPVLQQVVAPQRSATMPLPQQPWTQDYASQSSASSQVSTPSISRNPFWPPAQTSQPSIDQMFADMSIQQAPQPLFPHNTGSFQQSQGYGFQSNPFLRTFTPPTTPPSYSHGPTYDPFTATAGQAPPQQQQYQQQQQHQFAPQQLQPSYGAPVAAVAPQQTNPFLRMSRSQNFASSNPFGQQVQYGGEWGQAPAVPALPGWVQEQRSFSQPVAAQQAANGQGYGQVAMAQSPGVLEGQGAAGAFDNSFQRYNVQRQQATYPPAGPAPSSGWQLQQQQLQQQQQQQQGAMYPQATGRVDKASILALYNAPHLAPQRTAAAAAAVDPAAQGSGLMQQGGAAGAGTGSLNPFASSSSSRSVGTGAGTGSGGEGARHVSNESVDFTGLMGGRHSPDAFKGLSARVR